VGGVMYMVSDIVNVKSRARERMWAAMWGLILIVVAYLILYTINPQLVNFSSLFPNNSCSSTASASIPGSNSTAANSGSVETRYVNFNPDSFVADTGAGINSKIGIYTNSSDRAAFGCGFTDVCALSSRTYISFSDAASASNAIKDFQTKCEGGQTGISQYIPLA